MEFQSVGTYTVNDVTVPVVQALVPDEAGNIEVLPLLRSIDIAKMLNGSRTFFNSMVYRAEKHGSVFEECVDYFSVDKEHAAQFFGATMLGVQNLRMYTHTGFCKAVDKGLPSTNEGGKFVQDVEQYYVDAETSISESIADGQPEEASDVPNLSEIKKNIVDEYEPQSVDLNHSKDENDSLESSITINGLCLDDVLDKYEDDAPTPDNLVAGRPVKIKKKEKKNAKNKKRAYAKPDVSSSGTVSSPSWVKEAKPVVSSFAQLDMSIEKDWQEIIKNYPGAVKADNATPESKRSYDSIGDIVTPFPSDEEAPPTPPVQYVTRALSASERIKNYADSLDKEKHSDAYAAIVMMAAAVAAEGLEDNQIIIKPMKKPKKKLFSTEAVAEAFKTSKEVIEKISDELGLRTKKYGKFVTLVKTGDLMLVRFFYNKKAIRKFSEVLTLAGAEELENDK